MADDIDFEPELPPTSDAPSHEARLEFNALTRDPKPNTALIPLWRNGHISFNPESSVSVFALIALFLLLITALLAVLMGMGLSAAAWMGNLMTALGHAITAVVGAIVGSSVVSSRKSD